MDEHRTRDLLWRSPLAVDLLRYAMAALVVLSAAGAAALVAGRLPRGDVGSEAEDAVLLDLPPALASSAPPGDVAEEPPQPAMEAAAAVAPARPVEPEAPQPPPDEPPLPKEVTVPEPPIVKTQPAATPPPVAAAPAQQEVAPAGSPAPVKDAAILATEAAHRRAAHALSRWQQALAARIAGAKGGVHSGGDTGTVTLAFAIDRHGRLVASHVARSSGSPRLDGAALAMLARAAPFPDPPGTADEAALRFTIPVAFAARR